MEREDDWGRGRGGRTAVVREGRMVEARWVTQKKERGFRKWNRRWHTRRPVTESRQHERTK